MKCDNPRCFVRFCDCDLRSVLCFLNSKHGLLTSVNLNCIAIGRSIKGSNLGASITRGIIMPNQVMLAVGTRCNRIVCPFCPLSDSDHGPQTNQRFCHVPYRHKESYRLSCCWKRWNRATLYDPLRETSGGGAIFSHVRSLAENGWKTDEKSPAGYRSSPRSLVW
jgi:hypothetical protein